MSGCRSCPQGAPRQYCSIANPSVCETKVKVDVQITIRDSMFNETIQETFNNQLSKETSIPH